MLVKHGDNPNKELFNKIQTLQDKALRIINFLPTTVPAREIYSDLKNSKSL